MKFLNNLTIDIAIAKFHECSLLVWDTLPIVLPIILCIWLAVHIYRSYNHSPFPREFEIFTNSTYPSIENQRILRNLEVNTEFRRAHGGKTSVIDGDKYYSVDTVFAALVRQVVESSSRPILEITPPQIYLDIKLQGVTHKDDSFFTDGPHVGFRCLHPHIDQITFQGNDAPVNWVPVVIRGARICRIVIDESYRGWLRFEDCWIGSLEIAARQSDLGIRLSIARSYVGHLNLGSNGCIEFSMNNGGIKELVCPSPSMPSPVVKIFAVDDMVVLHQAPKSVEDEQINNYRNLLFHIRNLSSPLTQQIVSAAIFRLELKGDSGFHRFVNFCYGIFSAYNTKPGRPLIWMLSSFAVCFYIAFIFDLAVLTKDCNGLIVGKVSWVTELCDVGRLGKIFKSFALILNTVMNPFS